MHLVKGLRKHQSDSWNFSWDANSELSHKWSALPVWIKWANNGSSEEWQVSIYFQQQPHIPNQEELRIFSKYELRSISRMLIRLIRSNPRKAWLKQQKEGTYDQQVASLPHSDICWGKMFGFSIGDELNPFTKSSETTDSTASEFSYIIMSVTAISIASSL